MSKVYSFKELSAVLPHIARAGHPILLRGRHGIGKSSFVYQCAYDMADYLEIDEEHLAPADEKTRDIYGDRRPMKVIERRASQMTEGDIIGLPDKDELDKMSTYEKVTKFIPPKFIKQACEEPVILFLDEIDRAMMGVRQAIFQMTDSHALADNKFHPQTRIIAAVNGGLHGQNYTVREMDPAELDRWTVFDMSPSIEEWLEWCSSDLGNFHNACLSFLRQAKEGMIEHNGQPSPGQTYPSRRSWARFNKALTGMLENSKGGIKENAGLVTAIATGYLSNEVASHFTNYVLEDYKDRIKPEEFINCDPRERGNSIVDRAFNQKQHKIVDLIYELNQDTDVFEEQMSQEQLANLRYFFANITGEAQLLLLKELVDEKNDFVNFPSLGWNYIMYDEDADKHYVVPPALYSKDAELDKKYRRVEEIFLEHKGDDPSSDADPDTDQFSEPRKQIIEEFGRDFYEQWYEAAWMERYSFQDPVYEITVGEDSDIVERANEMNREAAEDEEDDE